MPPRDQRPWSDEEQVAAGVTSGIIHRLIGIESLAPSLGTSTSAEEGDGVTD